MALNYVIFAYLLGALLPRLGASAPTPHRSPASFNVPDLALLPAGSLVAADFGGADGVFDLGRPTVVDLPTTRNPNSPRVGWNRAHFLVPARRASNPTLRRSAECGTALAPPLASECPRLVFAELAPTYS